MTGSLRLLVVGHDAGRQGAPIVLLHLLTWLRDHSGFELELVLHHGGPLVGHYRRVLPTTVLNPFAGSSATIARIVRLMVPPATLDRYLTARIRRRLARRPPDVVWANSVASWKMLDLLAPVSIPRLIHVHELEYAIRAVGPGDGRLKTMADHFIAVSEAVRENLRRSHGISEGKVTVIHECVPSDGTLASEPRDTGMAEPLVVVGCGVGVPRKGFDLLSNLTRCLAEISNMVPFELRWIGAVSDDAREVLEHDLRTLGLDGCVTLMGEVEDPVDIMSEADLFILTSREDPFPLVCLEAARSHLPVVCFDRAGGMPELVENDAGIVVPYLDVAAMASAIHLLAVDRDLRLSMGDRAWEKVTSRYSVEVQAPKIAELLRRLARR